MERLTSGAGEAEVGDEPGRVDGCRASSGGVTGFAQHEVDLGGLDEHLQHESIFVADSDDEGFGIRHRIDREIL